ncbi:MAG: hypothetical protein U9O98_10745 [Asgard group archaeon]|nr:hypothetical protein [Asgard group archaeon]
MPTMKFYEVLEDGTLDEEEGFNPESNKVMIVVDDQFKRIYLWKGTNSGIKKKFIGSRAAAELRKTYYGFSYRLSVIEEGDETQEFEFTIKRSRGEADVGVIDDDKRGIPNSPTEMGLNEGVSIKLRGEEPAKPIMYSDNDKAGMSQFAGAPKEQKQSSTAKKPRPKRPEPEKQKARGRQRTILSEMMDGSEPKIIRPKPGSHTARKYKQQPATEAQKTESKPQAKAQAQTQAQPEQAPKPPQPPQPTKQKLMSEVDPKAAFSMIKELGVPAGYERDLVIVGTGVYKQQGGEFLVPPNPPEGVFLAPDRVPRLIIENGVVKVIEVLKKLPTEKDKKKEDIQLDQDIEDLMHTFQIEIE